MIVPMKKIHMIFHSSEWHTNLEDLQHLGLVDISVGSYDMESEIGQEYQEITHACAILKDLRETTPSIEYQNTGDINHRFSPYDVAKNINNLHHEKHVLLKEIHDLKLLHDELSKLANNVSKKDIQYLKEHKVGTHIYKANKKTSTFKCPEGVVANLLCVDSLNSYWLLITYDDAEFEVPLTWTEYKLTDMNAKEMEENIVVNKNQIVEIEELLKKEIEYANTLLIRKTELENTLMRENILNTSEKIDDSLLVIQGFFPVDKSKDLKEYIEDKSWGIVIDDPSEEDKVPTLIKTSKFVSIIKPMFRLMDTIPGYKEFDISAWFLLFITIFYAMIIGDAGYGALMFVFILIMTIKALKDGKAGQVHALMLWFSAATVAWGAMTGSWFGYAPFAELPFLKSLVVPAIANSNESSEETIKVICFNIGLVHLLLAHTWKAISLIRVNFWQTIHELAQGALLVGLYFVTFTLVLGSAKYPVPSFTVPLILGAFGLIVITAEQEKGRSFFVGLGKGLANLFPAFLGGVGSLADLISYIRLFAVGLASLKIAEAFNAMGLEIMNPDATPLVSIILIVLGALVIGLGHALNLAMALLAVLVHGVRLNMLEFGMHLGMEWTGRKFTPFQKKIISLEEK